MSVKNPFLTVTVEELDRNIAKATKILNSMNSLRRLRKQKHCCIICGEELSKGATKFVTCEKCRKKARKNVYHKKNQSM